ncbi:MAG: type II toxin-antitoxin system HicB family antitoxin [Parabacteroides sp.]|nr:type II toxin-antitoxin system HicB family antitoxin [Parabacteroides sp.]MDO4755118.1 type II toxin-antitoxin system HicB family antitoxin [Parabacteroides sp.]
MKYRFPAVFRYNKYPESYPDGVYEVEIVDLEGGYTFGTSLIEAIKNAEDLLNLMLCSLEDDGKEFPEPGVILTFAAEENCFVIFIDADTDYYREKVLKKMDLEERPEFLEGQLAKLKEVYDEFNKKIR